MPKSATTKNLIFSYFSTMCILGVLIIAAQVVIQLALRDAQRTENAYSVLNGQEIRTQRLIRNTLLTVGTPSDRSVARLSLAIDTSQWEQTQAAIDGGNASLHIAPSDFPATVHMRLDAAKNDFRAMQTALHGLILIESEGDHPDQKAVISSISIIFYRGGVYLVALQAAATELLADADAYTTRVSYIEYGLCALALLTLAGEAIFVFRPAIRHMQSYLQLLRDEQSERKHD